jgi:hypothetical protein
VIARPVTGHYQAVAERLLPFLAGRPVTLQHPGRLGGPSRRIETASEVAALDEEGGVGLTAPPVDADGEVWFALRMTTPAWCPFEVVRLSALKLALVLEDALLEPWFCYDGAGGLTLLWTWGRADGDDFPEGVEAFHARTALALQQRLEARLAGTPERDRVGLWTGYEGAVSRFDVLGGEPPAGDEVEGAPPLRLAVVGVVPPGRLRVPWSLHESSGRVVRPLSRDDLYRFDPEVDAEPDRVKDIRREFPVPYHPPGMLAREWFT